MLYKTVTGHVAINPDQIGLVAADNRTRSSKSQIQIQGNRGIFDWAARRYSFAVRTVSDWNQLPGVVVEQENPAALVLLIIVQDKTMIQYWI